MTAPAPAPPTPPRPAAPPIGALGTARWAWRQLTSMRVALVLLFLLALGAVPGSVLPQRGSDPAGVLALREESPGRYEWYDRLGLLDVYTSPWFAAVYLLLFVSLVGCIVPRTRQHWRALRARPPRAPRHLDRLPAYAWGEVDGDPERVREVARAVLRERRYRVAQDPDGALAAERGHWRETGNLLFHLSLVVVLAAVAVGSLFGYRADVLLTEGRGFANSVIQYDSIDAGPLFDPADLVPFTLRLDAFRMSFVRGGPNRGQPDVFEADVTVREAPGADARQETIQVNDPLRIDGTLVHALNPGYAVRMTVRDARGEVVLSEAVPFLPQDSSFTSTGVAKVPLPGDDIGVEALFLPTGVIDDRGPRSVSPEPVSPTLVMTAWTGDLGLDDGRPQSVFRLDTRRMVQETEGGEPWRAAIGVGQTAELPSGGTVTFDMVGTWVNLQVSRAVGQVWALGGIVAAILGLTLSMFVRRRRAWVRVSTPDRGRTVVAVGGLDRSPGGDLSEEVAAVLEQVRERVR